MQKPSMRNNGTYLTAKRFVEEHNLTFVKTAYRLALRGIRLSGSQLRQWSEALEWRRESRRLLRFKDIHHARRRCFIIGNGPSILQQDLTRLHDEIVFVTNDFALHEQHDEINPTYHCVSDRWFFAGGQVNRDWYEVIQKKTNSIKFFPFFQMPAIKRDKFFEGHEVFYLRYGGVPIWEVESMSLDITKNVYTGYTVIIDFCLPLAFYMGFSEIYLLGCDMDYKLDDMSDFSKAYFYDVRKAPRERTIPPYTDMMRSYAVVKEIFERHGRRICNAGVGGKLELFERVRFESILE